MKRACSLNTKGNENNMRVPSDPKNQIIYRWNWCRDLKNIGNFRVLTIKKSIENLNISTFKGFSAEANYALSYIESTGLVWQNTHIVTLSK